MSQMRICIYGGTDLKGGYEAFVSELAYQVLGLPPAIIVTGGFRHSNKYPNAISTDVAALRGAQRFAEERGIDLKPRFEAWIPEPVLDDRSDVQGAIRMSEADGIAVRVMKGRTPLGRRLAMVAAVDMVVTISGKQHTEVVVEQALDLGLPVLPIPHAGGDSQDLLEKYKTRIEAAFDPGALDLCLAKLTQHMGGNNKSAASAVVDLIRTARVGRCLVLTPYDEEHDRLYASVVEPAVAKQMIPVRLDRLPTSGSIYTSFADAIQSCSAVIADITALNENVMYEIGYSHGRGLTPLIYTRNAARLDQLPLYFRTLNVRLASDGMPIETMIANYLQSVKAARRLPASFS